MSDKLAMTLSSACAIHCFFSPTFLLLTSGLFSFSFDNESVHYLILFLAIPISLYALILGFTNHKTAYFLTIGIFGLFVFWKLPVRELPNGIQPPVVQVQVDYKSASASNYFGPLQDIQAVSYTHLTLPTKA